MESLLLDIRYGIRMLLKNPGYTMVAILALTLGIGANSAIFSVVNGVLLKPLPYEESENLLLLSERAPQLEGMSIAYPNFQDWREQNQVFEKIAVFRRQSFNITGGSEPERLTGGQVSADIFPALRARPIIGRTFLPEEDLPDGDQVVVLSYGLWQRRYGSDPKILGQTITMNGKGYTIIGVMPQNYQFPSRTELWVPVGQESGSVALKNRGNHSGLYGIARLKQGVSIEQARAEMDTISVRLEKQYPDSNTGNRVSMNFLLESIVSDLRPALLVLLSAVAFVLLIACANVANLFLARAATRQKEIAIRLAMGASRLRLIRQLLTESVLLSLIGGGFGLLLALWGIDALIAINPGAIPRSREVTLDYRVLVFTIGISFLTGIIFGFVPALQATRANLNETLKEAGRGSSMGISGRRFRSGLVIAEVALALVLLIGGGLMIRSFYLLQKVNPGFSTEQLLSFQISLPRARYSDEFQRENFYNQALEKLGNLPGVESAAISTGLPLGNNGNQTGFSIVGQPEPPSGKMNILEVMLVSPDYFRTMGMTLLKGRTITEEDNKERPVVIVIDELFAARHWPNEDPIGKQIKLGGHGSNRPTATVVGVVKRVKMDELDNDSNRVQGYLSYPQDQNTHDPYFNFAVVLRTKADPTSLTTAARQQILSIDKDQPIYNVKTLEQIKNESIAPQRMNLILLGIFAALALILAAVGIYGVISYAVTQRTHEIGIRLALGAQQRDILRLIISHAMLLAVVGVVIGLAASFALTRWMTSLLFGVSATDPLVYTIISLMLLIVSLLACFIPARRAIKVDPMVALRYE